MNRIPAAPHPSARSPIPCGDVCSGGGYRTAPATVSTTDDNGARLPHDSRPRPLVLSNAVSTAGASHTVVRVVTHDGGFHWGDAGIGAGGVLALSILAIGGVMAFSHRRIRRGEAALTT